MCVLGLWFVPTHSFSFSLRSLALRFLSLCRPPPPPPLHFNWPIMQPVWSKTTTRHARASLTGQVCIEFLLLGMLSIDASGPDVSAVVCVPRGRPEEATGVGNGAIALHCFTFINCTPTPSLVVPFLDFLLNSFIFMTRQKSGSEHALFGAVKLIFIMSHIVVTVLS